METTKLFVMWLDGFLEACGNELNEAQTKVVKDKLNSLFHHEAETVIKPTLEELGQQFNFPVFHHGLHGYESPSEEGTMRC